jgi:hypothetical protein
VNLYPGIFTYLHIYRENIHNPLSFLFSVFHETPRIVSEVLEKSGGLNTH